MMMSMVPPMSGPSSMVSSSQINSSMMVMPGQAGNASAAPNPVSPETISQYIGAEGVTGHAQAAALSVQAYQNQQFPLAQLFGKIASNPAFAKSLAGTDGDTASISWQDLGKLANGKPFIARQDVGLLPKLNEAFMLEMATLSRLQPSAPGAPGQTPGQMPGQIPGQMPGQTLAAPAPGSEYNFPTYPGQNGPVGSPFEMVPPGSMTPGTGAWQPPGGFPQQGNTFPGMPVISGSNNTFNINNYINTPSGSAFGTMTNTSGSLPSPNPMQTFPPGTVAGSPALPPTNPTTPTTPPTTPPTAPMTPPATPSAPTTPATTTPAPTPPSPSAPDTSWNAMVSPQNGSTVPMPNTQQTPTSLGF
jgi:hypothetical protein